MTRQALLIVLVLAVPSLALAAEPSPKVDGKASFEKLKSLAGKWEGTVEEGGAPAQVVYAVSVNGLVVTETMFPGTPHEMMTLYYLEGSDLKATHYCGIGNRPQFKLDAAASTPDSLVFAFDGGSGFDAAKDTHIHAGRIGFKDGSRLEAEWALYRDGKQAGAHKISLGRK